MHTALYSQELKTAKNIPIFANVKDTIPQVIKDSIRFQKDSLLSKTVDTLKAKEILESIITHSADSLIRQDIKNNKMLMYNTEILTYKLVILK